MAKRKRTVPANGSPEECSFRCHSCTHVVDSGEKARVKAESVASMVDEAVRKIQILVEARAASPVAAT